MDLPKTIVDTGLSSDEAAKRLAELGPNEFEKKREFSNIDLLLTQLKSPLIYVLVAAGSVTMLLHEWIDTFVIFLVVFVNTSLGFWQERKAAKSLEALKGYLKPMVTVVRDDKRVEIPMGELVPGDVVLLSAGASVPADGVVVESKDLSVNESLLTGESRGVGKKAHKLEEVDLNKCQMVKPQDKKAKQFVYMGTTVSAGVARVVVLSTGAKTEMGKIAESLQTTEEGLTPLQQKLAQLAKLLMYVVVGTTAMILAIGIFRGEEIIEMFETAVAVAVAAVPEGLAVSMTVILALGMQRILKRNALVRKLVAAETLGSVSVICSDKTGTLTEGKMRVVNGIGDRDDLVLAAMLANDRRDEEGVAMDEWATTQAGHEPISWTKLASGSEVRKKFKRLDSRPFSSDKKYMVSLNQLDQGKLLCMAGAPETVLKNCYMSDKRRNEEMKKVREMASKGYRLIAFATKKTKSKKINKGLINRMGWAGFVVFEDPVRANVREALLAAKRAGVEVKVITGDYKETAVAVLRKVLGDDVEIGDEHVVMGEDLAKMSKEELKAKIGGIKLFARTAPDQKLKIVEALKERGEVVAMTGDGVNDAPALKASDIGIVVNEATDVSKQTADMVLLDSNFGTIVEAIREGRVIFQTMRKTVVYLVSNSFQEIVLIGGGLLLGLPLPLSAVQILWINLVQDGLPGVALAFETNDEGVMNEQPRRRDDQILDLEGKSLIVVIGLVANLLLLSVFFVILQLGYSEEYARTLMFLGLGTNTLLFIFSAKALRHNLWHQDLFNNKFLLMAVGVGALLMLASLSIGTLRSILGVVPVKISHGLIVVGVNLLSLALIEAVKFVFIRRYLSAREA